jgi:hypothetical protein
VPEPGSASDTSIAVSGAAGALEALVLDNNLPPGLGHARIRSRCVARLPRADAYINFVKQFGPSAPTDVALYRDRRRCAGDDV